MTPTVIREGQPFSEERTTQIIADFKRDGFVLIPGVLEPEEVMALREKTESLIDDPQVVRDGYVQLVERVDRLDEPYILRHTKELDRIFCDLLVREPIIGLMDAVFGPNVQQCGMNVLRNDSAKAIDEWHIDDALFHPLPDDIPRHDSRIDLPIFWLTVQMPLTDIDSMEYGPTQFVFGRPNVQQCGMNVLRNDSAKAIDEWHIDDALFHPLPDDIPRHDSRIDLPIFWLTVQMPLTDIDSMEYGPTQFVPGSHYSGRHPPESGPPEFEGRGPVSVFCKAGDIYLHNPQCWHRGAPNRSDRVRYLLQNQYGAKWGFMRYNAYVNHPMPSPILEGASERMLRVLDRLQFFPEERYPSGYIHPDDRPDSA